MGVEAAIARLRAEAGTPRNTGTRAGVPAPIGSKAAENKGFAGAGTPGTPATPQTTKVGTKSALVALDLFARWDERAAYVGDDAAAAEVGFEAGSAVVADVLDHLDDAHRHRLAELRRVHADEGDALAMLASEVGEAEGRAADGPT